MAARQISVETFFKKPHGDAIVKVRGIIKVILIHHLENISHMSVHSVLLIHLHMLLISVCGTCFIATPSNGC